MKPNTDSTYEYPEVTFVVESFTDGRDKFKISQKGMRPIANKIPVEINFCELITLAKVFVEDNVLKATCVLSDFHKMMVPAIKIKPITIIAEGTDTLVTEWELLSVGLCLRGENVDPGILPIYRQLQLSNNY
jgi:hypothetical protein